MFTQDPFLKRNEKGVLNLVDRVIAAPNQKVAMLYIGTSGDANELIIEQRYIKNNFTGIDDFIKIVYSGSSDFEDERSTVELFRSICASFEEKYEGRMFNFGVGDKNQKTVGIGTGTIISATYTGDNADCSLKLVGILNTTDVSFSKMKVEIRIGTISLQNISLLVNISPIFIENNFFNASTPYEQTTAKFLYAPTSIGEPNQVLVGASSPAAWKTVECPGMIGSSNLNSITITGEDIRKNPFGIIVYSNSYGTSQPIVVSVPNPTSYKIPVGYRIMICNIPNSPFARYELKETSASSLFFEGAQSSTFYSSNCIFIELTKSFNISGANIWQINEKPRLSPYRINTATTTTFYRAPKHTIIDIHSSGTSTLDFSSIIPKPGDVIEIFKFSTGTLILKTNQTIYKTNTTTTSKETTTSLRSYLKLVYYGTLWYQEYHEQ